MNDCFPIHGSENEGGALSLALDLTRRGAEAISCGGGIFANSPLAAQLEALRRVAEERQWFANFEFLNRQPDARGFEHEVWFPRESGRDIVFKATYDNSFGVKADGGMALPVDYLERMQLQNQIFGDSIKFEGLWQPRPGVFRIITSQPAVQGRPATDEEVTNFFESNGYCRFVYFGQSLWFNAETRTVCADTHGGNILVDSHGGFAAIDVPVMVWPSHLSDPQPITPSRTRARPISEG